jgi:hypothetical protein
VLTPKSFRAVLRSFEESSALGSDHRAHVRRWADDNRAEELWNKIKRAAQKNNVWLPAKYFIQEILAARRVAMGIGHRGKLRERYRNAADDMERVAKFLRQPHPYSISAYPTGIELARKLDDAASYFRKVVEPTRNIPGVLKFSRESKPHMVFMSMVGNDLKGLTGRWLDEEVAVLTEIAFDSPDVIGTDAARWARRQRAATKTVRKARR